MTTPLRSSQSTPDTATTEVQDPQTNGDGTRTALVAGPLRQMGSSMILPLHLPTGLTQRGVGGRYFLARCGEQSGAVALAERTTSWEIYLRRPLYAAMHFPVVEPMAMDRWEFLLPRHDDPGYRWLAAQPVGAPINLLGPYGVGYTLQPNSRNLLLLADSQRLPLLIGLADTMLDRGGRVTLVLRAQTNEDHARLRNQLPIPVELQLVTTATEWQQALADTIRWADQIAVALSAAELPAVGQAIAQHRFRFEENFAHALIEADLLCGTGACLACVVPTKAGGYTRACVHGPVFDLKSLV